MLDEAKLKSVVAAVFEVDPSEINEQSNMDTIESWDSLKHMDLILTLEEEFGITIPDEEAGDLTSYSLIKLVVNEQVEGKS